MIRGNGKINGHKGNGVSLGRYFIAVANDLEETAFQKLCKAEEVLRGNDISNIRTALFGVMGRAHFSGSARSVEKIRGLGYCVYEENVFNPPCC